MKNRCKRILAVILTVALTLISIPIDKIWGDDEPSLTETAEIVFTVVDEDNSPLTGVIFKIEGVEVTPVVDESLEENEYKLSFETVSEVTTEITVEKEGYNSKTITYTHGIDSDTQEVLLYETVQITVENTDGVSGDNIYTVEKLYSSDISSYDIFLSADYECTIVNDESSLSAHATLEEVDDSYNWRINYSQPGETEVKIYDNKGNETLFKLILKDEIEYNFDELENHYDKVDRSQETGIYTAEITVSQAADTTIDVELSSEYPAAVSYTSSNKDVATIDTAGIVTITGIGETVITAKSDYADNDAQYILKVYATESSMSMHNSGNLVLENYTYIFDAINDIGKEFTVTAEIAGSNSSYYSISYSSEDESVATVDSSTGKVTIKGAGETVITIQATPRCFWLIGCSTSYNIKVNKSAVTAKLIDSEGSIFDEEEVILLYDTEENCDVVKDELGNGESLTLPLQGVQVYDSLNNQLQSSDINVEFQCTPLTFSGYTITNPDEIERNTEYSVQMTISSVSGVFNDIVKNIKFRLVGNVTNNRGYYTIEGIAEGLDHNMWKIKGEDVIIKAVTINEGTEDEYTYYIYGEYDDLLEEAVVAVQNGEKYNKEHKFQIKYDARYSVSCREYFGVDENAPVLAEDNGILLSENAAVMPYGIYSNDTVAITVNATDAEGNLFDALLYIDGVQTDSISASEVDFDNGIYTFTFYLDKNTYIGINKNVKVVIRDAAGNTAPEDIGDIIIEENKPEGYIAISQDSNAVVINDANGNHYADRNVRLILSVTDAASQLEEDVISGLGSFEVWINNRYYETVSYENDDDKTISDDSYILNTANYVNADKCVKVELKNIYDMAGNKGTDKTFVIYIDETEPTVQFEKTQCAGEENRTSYGNFYNNDVKLVFKVTDAISGVETAILKVGEKTFSAVKEGEYITFTIKPDIAGDASLYLKDKVGNDITLMLKDIQDINNRYAFTSSYVMLEDNSLKADFNVNKAANNGKWYSSNVELEVKVYDDYNGVMYSGIKNVSIFVNDKEYGIPATYYSKDVSSKTYKVILDDNWINDVMNADGSYNIKVVVEDNAGNKGTYNNIVYIDKVAPVISQLTGVEPDSSNTGVVTVNVEVFEKHFAESGNTTTVNVTRELDGEIYTYEADEFIPVSANAFKAYEFREEGTYTVEVVSQDAAGNKAEPRKISFIVDNTSPLADITGVEENAYYLDSVTADINIIETNYKDMTVAIEIVRELNGESFVVESESFEGTKKSSTCSKTFDMEGTYTIKVDAVDEAGNVAVTRTVIFTVDTAAPEIIIKGVSNESAYKGDVIPEIGISDNYYKSYSVQLIKSGIYFNDSKTDINSLKNVDVTSDFIGALSSVRNGVYGSFDTFEKIQDNDGIYVLTVTAEDFAGRITTKTIRFSVNRFGSVYTFDSNLTNILDTYNQSIDTDFVITEYNADKLIDDSIKLRITRDGTPMENIVYDTAIIDNNQNDNSWYQYIYTISKENFKYDGVYTITVSSADEAGNNSENITYDELSIRFSVDTVKPELVKVTGLSKNSYNAQKIDVTYAVFDAVAIKEVRVYVNDEEIQKVSNFEDITSYEGVFSINEGVEQSIRFEVEDMSGNIVNSDNSEDIKSGKIAIFEHKVTISTNFFIRWYANPILFYGSIIALVLAIIIVVFIIVRKKGRRI